MSAVSMRALMSIKCNENKFIDFIKIKCFMSLTLCVIFYLLIFGVHSEEIQINRSRERVIAINDKIAKDNNNDILANSRPNWWQKKVDKRPTLVVSDEPTGTGVPTWKEIDMFSADERRGRSYAYRTDRTDNSSLNAHQYVPSLPVLILLNVFLFSFNSY